MQLEKGLQHAIRTREKENREKVSIFRFVGRKGSEIESAFIITST